VTLREDLRRITAEIRDYPRPIAGCDAQFNHLLEQRAELERQLCKEEEARCS